MKHWITTIFFLAGKLGKLVDGLTKEMENYAISLTMETFRVLDTLMKLEDKKRRLCNFKVLAVFFKSKLDNEQIEIVRRRIIKGETFEEVASVLEISKSTAGRKYSEAINKSIAASLSLTYDEDRLLEDYKDIPLIMKTYNKFVKNAGVK